MEKFDIHRLLKILINSKFYIIGILMLFLAAGYFYSFFYVTPIYQSSATVVLVQNDSTTTPEDTSITQTDITLNQNLLATYTKIAKSDKILSQVIENLGLSFNSQQLAGLVTVQAVNNTEVFKITVKNENPELAASITNELLSVFSNEVKNLYNMNNVYAMDKAEIATAPSNINHIKDLMMFGAFGMALSLGLVFAIYLLDTTIKSEQDIEDYVGLSVLSTIPVQDTSKFTTELIVNEQPKSPIAECFKTFRTNVMFSIQNKELNTILVTSGFTSEGKSFVSSNLAVTFAQSGKKVILMDTDMRKGRQHKIFGLSHKNGLSNCLADLNSNQIHTNINQYIQNTSVSNLHVMTSGNVPPNPSELLSSHAMKQLLTALHTQYDVIICDGTPCMLVSDSIILSKIVDTTVLVTSNRITKLDTLQKMKKSIQMVGGNIGGAVINKMTVNAKSYQNQYYYGNHHEVTQKIESEDHLENVLNHTLHIVTTLEELPIVEEVTTKELGLPEAMTISDTMATSFTHNLASIQSEVAQMKQLYQSFMQNALVNTKQKPIDMTPLFEEITSIQTTYQTMMQEQNLHLEELQQKMNAIPVTDNTSVLEKVSQMKLVYEEAIQAQSKQLENVVSKLSNLEKEDSSDVLTEVKDLKQTYQEAIQMQSEKIASLQEYITTIALPDTQDTIMEELGQIKDSYYETIDKQEKQMETLHAKLEQIELNPTSTSILEELNHFQETYHHTIESQNAQIHALQHQMQTLDNSEIVLTELSHVKEAYEVNLQEQFNQIRILQDKIEHIELPDSSQMVIGELKNIQSFYHETMDKQANQIETLHEKLEQIEADNTSTNILEELNHFQEAYHTTMEEQSQQMYALQHQMQTLDNSETILAELSYVKENNEVNLQEQSNQIKTLHEKLSTLEEQNSSKELIVELSKLSRQIENINHRFDILEEKAQQSEKFMQSFSQKATMEIAKKEKMINVKKLNEKVIQIRDYLENQVEDPIEQLLVKPEKKKKSILEGQLNLLDSTLNQKIESTEDLKTQTISTSVTEEKTESTKYVVDYARVENKQKRGFNFFKNKNKEVQEENEEPVVFVSQILSGTVENVG